MSRRTKRGRKKILAKETNAYRETYSSEIYSSAKENEKRLLQTLLLVIMTFDTRDRLLVVITEVIGRREPFRTTVHSYVYLCILSGQFRNSSTARTSFVDLVFF